MTPAQYLERLSPLVGIPQDQLSLQHIDYTQKWVPLLNVEQYIKAYSHHWTRYKVQGPGAYNIITCFSLCEFPGCCAFIVSTGAYVYDAYRKKGVNKLTNEFRQAIGRYLGYTAIICTDVEDNVGERLTLKANGWRDIYGEQNKRTGNFVNISIKEL